MSSQPVSRPVASSRAGAQREYVSPAAAFIRGNYFYVLSAVAFLAGCYLLINAPFITGAVFVRTLKSFLVLQGYEVLLLGAAGFITWKIGRGGDVATLFLIALALMLDPTFFGNAFYTIRQGVPPAWPVAVCGLSLAAALVKFEVFRRLLRLVVSWRYIVGFVIAACVVWLAGLVFRRDLAPETITWYSYGLAWAALIVTIIQGAPYAACHLPGETEKAKSNVAVMATLIPPLLCAVHQVELTKVFDLQTAFWVYAPYWIGTAFAFVRAARPSGDEGVWYMFAYFSIGAALYLSFVNLETQPVVPGTRVTVGLAVTGVATGLVFAYGYWKHRSKVAFYALASYCAAIVFGLLVYWFSVYVLPVIWDWRLPDVIKSVLTFRSVTFLAAVGFGVAAYRMKSARLWLFSVWSAILFVTRIVPGGYESWTMEMLQAMLAALLVYSYKIGAPADDLRKGATLLICVALARNVFAPNSFSLSLLLVESVGFLFVSHRFRDFYYAVWGAIGLVMFGGNVAGEVLRQIHPSIVAIGVGLLLFAVGLAVTFKKGATPVAAVAGATESASSGVQADESVMQQRDLPGREGAAVVDSAGTENPVTVDLTHVVLDVFKDDPDAGIRQVSGLGAYEVRRLQAVTAIDALQPLVVVYGASGEFHGNYLFLTPVQIAIVTGKKAFSTRLISYGHLAEVGREQSTIAIRTHAGAGFLFACDNPLQAELVGYGFEQVIVELILRLKEARHGEKE